MTPFSSHPYVLLFLWILAEQLGLPLPSVPILLAAGAGARAGEISFPLAILLSLTASLVPDTCWYLLGRYKGVRVLNLLCRMSIEPDSCVTRTRLTFQKRGYLSILSARFIPGVGLLTPPLAGVLEMPYLKFLAFDAMGTSLWATGYLLLGALLQSQINRTLIVLRRVGASFIFTALLIAAIYALYKWVDRVRFLRKMRIARIDPLEVLSRIENGEDFLIVDLRSDPDFRANPVLIPGALRISPLELEKRHLEISRYSEIALYCT